MKHYVNLKFRTELFSQEILEKTRSVLNLAVGQITGFRNFELLKAKDWDESHFEVLLVLDFLNEESLKVYLGHDLHLQLLQIVKPYLDEKAIFDGEL